MAKNDFKEIARDVEEATLKDAIVWLLCFLGVTTIFMLFIHLDFTAAAILTFVCFFALYVARKDLYSSPK